MHILPNISRSKDNQSMKFGELVEYNMRKIIFEKSYTKCGGKTIARNYTYLWINSRKFYTVSFYYLSSGWPSKHTETNLLAFTSCKAF